MCTNHGFHLRRRKLVFPNIVDPPADASFQRERTWILWTPLSNDRWIHDLSSASGVKDAVTKPSAVQRDQEA